MGWRIFVLASVLAACACRSTIDPVRPLYEAARHSVRCGELNRALEEIAEAETRAGDPSSEWSWKLRLLRAEVHLLLRETTAAQSLLNASLPSGTAYRSIEVRRTSLLAQVKGALGHFAEAIQTLETARQQAIAASADDERLDIDTLHAQMLLRLKNWTEANTLLEDVVSRASDRGDTYRLAVALHNMALGHLLRKKYDEALRLFQRLLGLKDIQNFMVYGTALTNAGISLGRMGQFDKAVELQQQAVKTHESRGRRTFLGLALGELGTTYLLQDDPRQALPYLSRAFEVSTSTRAPDAPLWAGNLAKVAIDLGNYEQAEHFNQEAIRLKTALKRSTIYNTYYSALIATGRGQVQDATRLYEAVLRAPDGSPGLQWESHDGLARVALSAGRKRDASDHFDAALRIIRATRSDLLATEYRVSFLSRVTRFYRNYVDTLVAAGDIHRALEVTDSSRGVVLAERMGGSAGHFQTTNARNLIAAAKRSGSVWLSYWLAPERSYVWVVTGDGVHSVPLAGSAQIEQLVQQYRVMVESSSVDPLAKSGTPGDALYAMVVAPVAQFIPPGSSVRIVPDGALHNVNFETLPVDGPRRHYWIEDVTVAIAPSLGLLASNAARADTSGDASLLLVGDPTPRVKEFPRLGYAPVEMQAVSKHFSTSRTVRHDSDRATPAQFLAAEPDRFSVIHFTAHAAANRTSPLESAVILAGPAGADRLYARDVAERSLKAELVTISACRSAGERAYAGEGLIGFSWAFLRAGARQVIAGLWDVDDQSTATLMDALYAGIARGDPAPTALRAAKLALMQRGGNIARPYYWGPFEVFTVSP
jgi:CHAT domain-containing protein/Tfp pilus assembly protein PilF